MVYSVQVDLTGSPEDLDALMGALAPEQADEVPGTESRLTRVGPGQATLSITGGSAPPVRAAVNAYIGWVRTIEGVLDVEPGPPSDEVV